MLTPAIAGLIEPEMHAAKVDIHEVSTARAVEVGEKEPFRVEVDVEMRRMLHGDALPEASVPEVGPVLDAAVMHQDDVIEAVPRHIGQADASCWVIEKDIWECVQVVRAWDGLRRRKALLAQTREPEEMFCLGHERVGAAVSRQIHQPHIGIMEIEAREDLIRFERLPGAV